MSNENDLGILVEDEISRLINRANLEPVRKNLEKQDPAANSEAREWARMGYPTRTALYLSLSPSLSIRQKTSILALAYTVGGGKLKEAPEGYIREAAKAAFTQADRLLMTLH